MVTAALEHHLIDLDIWTNVKEYLAKLTFLAVVQAFNLLEKYKHLLSSSFFRLVEADYHFTESEWSKLCADGGVLC